MQSSQKREGDLLSFLHYASNPQSKTIITNIYLLNWDEWHYTLCYKLFNLPNNPEMKVFLFALPSVLCHHYVYPTLWGQPCWLTSSLNSTVATPETQVDNECFEALEGSDQSCGSRIQTWESIIRCILEKNFWDRKLHARLLTIVQ